MNESSPNINIFEQTLKKRAAEAPTEPVVIEPPTNIFQQAVEQRKTQSE